MKPRLRHITLLLLAAALSVLADAHARALPGDDAAATDGNLDADTVIQVDRVQVTAIKQGLVLRNQPVASSILGERMLERRHIDALKEASLIVPNLHIPDYGSRMTSSIYVRGLGARIDQPVMGLNVDNVPVLNKDNYDTQLADVERIEVLRGPQSTLYGRNTMGGVINVYTLSPLTYEGVRLGMEYGSGNTLKLRASAYQKLREGLGLSVTGFYNRSDGFFENHSTGKRCDWEENVGGRWRLQWRDGSRWQIDNTFSVSVLNQGGYPYAYVGEEITVDGQSVIRPGEISYNDPSSYDRTMLSNGLTVRYEAERFSIASITSYQYSDDEMVLDQDFLPLSYFTLRQARTEHTVTEDIVIRKRGEGRYRWLFGAFGLMDAPVRFKQYGIDELILKHVNQVNPDYVDVWDSDNFVLGSSFRMPTLGAALYHESELRAGRWRFTAGLRFDYEHATLRYRNFTDTGCKTYRTDDEGNRELVAVTPIKIDTRGTLRDLFTELLPKVTVTYSFDENRNLYLSVAKGYKAGGFNTQMFSDVLQQQIMKEYFHVGTQYDIREVVGYDPEYSWNYELGGHFSCLEGAVRGDFALFWIDCHDQQLTVFPDGSTTGRMMTNAGRTRSLGAEVAVQATPHRNVELNVAYGYTDARFVEYDNGIEDYAGKRIPYAPEHTFSAVASWELPIGRRWLERIVLQADLRGTGSIAWNEQNSLRQPFYLLTGASVRFEQRHFSLDLWGHNLADTHYDVFYFRSIGNDFVQRGRPRTFGVTLNINL